MPSESNLFAVDEKGNPCLENILAPFFNTVAPALEGRCDTLTIIAEASNGTLNITADFSKGEAHCHLNPDPDFRPGIAFLRIRVLADLPLDSHETETGVVIVQFKGHRLPINVQLTSREDREVLVLKPNWDAF